MPQRHMRIVADIKLLAKGAINMAAANIKCPPIHTVRRSGFMRSSLSSKPATARGGRCVYEFCDGDRTIMGRKKAPTKLTVEYIMSAALPMRPMSPSTSVPELLASGSMS